MQETRTDCVTKENLSEQDLDWASLGIHTYIKAAIIAAAIYGVFHVEIYAIVFRWLHDSSWSHGFIIPAFSVYFLCQRKKEILTLEPRTNWLGLLFMIGCLVFYCFVTFVYKFGYLKSIAIIPLLGSIVLLIGGWKLVKYTWLPVVYLIFAIPLPARIYNDITIPMRQFAALMAAQILSFVNGMEATAKGVVIDVVYNGIRLEPSLDVAEACSGMRLLMAFVALGVAMAYLHYRPAWQRFVLLICTVPIAVFCNVVRVTITGFIYVLWDSKYAQGIYHDGLGILMLPLAFGIYGLIAWFMSNLLVEEGGKAVRAEDVIIRRKDSQE